MLTSSPSCHPPARAVRYQLRHHCQTTMSAPSEVSPLAPTSKDEVHLPVQQHSTSTPTNATVSATGAFLQGFAVAVLFGPVAVAVVLWMKSVDGSSESDRNAYRRGAVPGLALWAFIVVVVVVYVYKDGTRGV